MTVSGRIFPVSAPAAVISAFAVLKLFILMHFGALRVPDTMGYQAIADAMRHDPTFWIRIPDWDTAALPRYAFRPIGYPLLLVLTHAWPVTVLLQIAMSIAVAWLLSRIIRDATSSQFLAAAAAAVYLGGETLLWDNSILSDTFYAALFNFVILSVLRAHFFNRPLSLASLLLLGLVWGYSIWIRENGLFLTILPLGLVMLSENRIHGQIRRAATFLFPVICMVCLYSGWNYARTGQVFIGITGAANYLWPVFSIAKAGHVDPFADGSFLSMTAKHTAIDYGYPDQVAVIAKLHSRANLGPLALQKLQFSKLIGTIRAWPLAYAGVVLQNCNPLNIAPVIFDPLFSVNEFYQLGIPPYKRIVPGSSAKNIIRMSMGKDYPGIALVVSSIIAQILSTALFLWVVSRLLWEAARSAFAWQRPSRRLVLGLQSLAVFFTVLISFALIHCEARHLMPVIPAFLIATAIALNAAVSQPLPQPDGVGREA